MPRMSIDINTGGNMPVTSSGGRRGHAHVSHLRQFAGMGS